MAAGHQKSEVPQILDWTTQAIGQQHPSPLRADIRTPRRTRRKARLPRKGREKCEQRNTSASQVSEPPFRIAINILGVSINNFGRSGKATQFYHWPAEKARGGRPRVVSRVSVMSMLPRMSMVSEGYSAAAMVLCFGGNHGAR